MNGERRQIPHSGDKWNLTLPDGMLNSLVAASGKVQNDPYNFDEWDDDKGELESSDVDTSGWDELAKNS